MSDITVVPIDETKTINDEAMKTLSDKLVNILEMEANIKDTIQRNHEQLVDMTTKLNEEIVGITNMLQIYSASIHTAMHKTMSSIDVINNTINTVGLPKNGSSNKSASNNNNSASVSSTPAKNVRRNISINILFSYVYRLVEGDDVKEAPDLQSIIEAYELNNKVDLRKMLEMDNLLDPEEKIKFDTDWNKIKKESEKTNKKKASIIWALVKKKPGFSEKFGSFKQYYCESAENRS